MIYDSNDLFIALKEIIDLPECVSSLDLHLEVGTIPTVTMVCEANKDVPYLKIVKFDRKEFKFQLVRIDEESN